jgi:hypothetical protein
LSQKCYYFFRLVLRMRHVLFRTFGATSTVVMHINTRHACSEYRVRQLKGHNGETGKL